ncbi:hypothetical protein F4821DRAFT_275914 [Hypoxylon rubiginosum]|uniref:Uncharacterized protein n=1 Tax=Hypoxylon rubiginosum TaxID=110542 RepID=A0ACC0DA01_9PEZI|nr:hypothetical protein F4821DRAFT_275914 [Hypoxylon rubiginosum]
MVRESQDTQRPGTPRPRSGANTSRHSRGTSDGGSISSSKGSVFSKVMSSFRHKHHDDKQKADGQAKQQEEDGDWISNYKITHRPDRPRVDKRTVRERTSTEYMAELLRIQARSQQHYEVNHPGGRSMDKRLTPPSSPPPLVPPHQQQLVHVQAAATSDYSSPRSPRMGSPSPLSYSPSTTFTRHQRSPSGDQYPTTMMRGHQRMPSEPMSPDAMTIQVYRGSLIDRSASCPQPAEHNQVQLLPQKTYNPNESYAKRTIAMRDSGYAGRKGSSSSASTSTTDSHSVHRKAPSTNLHSTATATAAAATTFVSQPLTSSPTSYTSPTFTFAPPPQRAVRSLSPRNNNIPPANLPAISPKTCVMPGCRAPLLSALDCEQNVCGPCRKEYRQSTFDAGMSIARPPPPPPLSARAPLTSNLETLRALVGTAGLDGTFDTVKYGNGNGNRDGDGGDTRVTAVERGPLAPLVNKSTSNFQSSVAFKLQPAPPGRKRRQRVQQKAGSGSSSGSGGGTSRPPQPPVSAWSDSTLGSQTTHSHIYSSDSGSGSQHVAYQDRRLYRSSRKISDGLPKQPSPVEESSREEAAAEAEVEGKGAQYGFYLTESPRSSTVIRSNDNSNNDNAENENRRNSSDSWTSASPPKSLDSKDSDASLSPLSEPLESPKLHISPLRPTRYVPPGSEKTQKRSHSDGSAAASSSHRGSALPQPLRLAPAAPITRSANKAAGTSSNTIPAGSIRVLSRLPPPPSPLPSPPLARRPGRDTLLYQAIDDIIDSYAGVADDEFRASGVERWRADAIAASPLIYEDPEDVEMRKKGFF